MGPVAQPPPALASLSVNGYHSASHSYRELENTVQPRPVWLSWLEIVPQSGRLLVLFPVGAHAWVAGLVRSQSVYERQQIDASLLHSCFCLSLSPSPPLSLKNTIKKVCIGLRAQCPAVDGQRMVALVIVWSRSACIPVLGATNQQRHSGR